MTLTPEEVERAIRHLAHSVDGGCSTCTRDACRALDAALPGHAFEATLTRLEAESENVPPGDDADLYFGAPPR